MTIRNRRLLCVCLLLLPPNPLRAQDEKAVAIVGWLGKNDALDRVRKQSHHKVHEIALTAGRLMMIELRSVDFGGFLRLEDAAGKTVAENDGAEDRNARLCLVPPKTGV